MSTEKNTARARFSIERVYTATLTEAWDLWTSKEGIESWWGPEGFDVRVLTLDLRAGGELVYLMTATAPEQVAFMQRAGMPLSTECRIRFTDVIAPRLLAYTTLADFIPNVTPYEVATIVELEEVAGGVKLVVSFDAMHDEVWTERARAGHESELRKLDAVLAARTKGVRER
jgi:uncharacterized protein YndB with AHSA1/START domain